MRIIDSIIDYLKSNIMKTIIYLKSSNGIAINQIFATLKKMRRKFNPICCDYDIIDENNKIVKSINAIKKIKL